MNRTALALSLVLAMLVSAVAATGSAEVAPTTSPVWVEVARGSGGIAHDRPPENGTDLFSVSHLEWRVRWSVVPVDSGLPVVDGSDFRFFVRPEFDLFVNVGEVSGKVFSEAETGTMVIQNSLNRTFYIEAHIAGYTSYELIVEENVNSPLLDMVPPTIVVFSPENKTYVPGNITLTFTVDKPTSLLWYKIDNYGKAIILRNYSIPGLPKGTHNITVYARDEVGNIQASEMIYFTIEEPFTTPLIVAAVIMGILNLGLLTYYLKKRKG
jgi:hypothetical protein